MKTDSFSSYGSGVLAGTRVFNEQFYSKCASRSTWCEVLCRILYTSKEICADYVIHLFRKIPLKSRVLCINFTSLYIATKYAQFQSIAAKCLRALSGIFSSNLIDQSACKMGLALACVIIILHDDWSIRSRENKLNRILKHFAAMLFFSAW